MLRNKTLLKLPDYNIRLLILPITRLINLSIAYTEIAQLKKVAAHNSLQRIDGHLFSLLIQKIIDFEKSY